ncbi:hypothetical protein [Paenibacillus soyae]|uniref:Lipoprotein n=1 Tax=Paenibacillus soyae TaxID=2969249 RepID=A0A9X2SCC7_9BACL|nr:hypothetical protein [Paenibacillus soyae]MCR2805897.1 hypothetical protein [Paenibacillus soyae]
MTRRKYPYKRTVIGMLAAAILLGGCGADKQTAGGAGSFGDAAPYEPEQTQAAASTAPAEAATAAADPTAESAESASPPIANAGGEEQASAIDAAADTPEASAEPAGSVTPAASSAPADSQASATAKPAATAQAQTEATAKPAVSAPAQSTKPAPSKQPAATKPAPSGKPAATPAPEKESNSKYPQIGWSEFFDNEDQTTPSNRFWELSDERKTVQIKGFMGEVLSFDQNWFLLIPEPGAECPFDNGDETYWNKIMIVFVKDGTKLRYTSEPLQLTGRLDVGIKVDESGYKTMFRLYDAKFEPIKD